MNTDMITETNIETEETIMAEKQQRQSIFLGADGHMTAHNISAYWLPEIPIQEVIHGTVYTVTGSYEGNQPFIKKLERIMAKQFAEEIATENEDQEEKIDDKQAE